MLNYVFVNWLILYIVSQYVPQLGFSISSAWSCTSVESVLVLWAIFTLMYNIAWNIVKLMALPFRILLGSIVAVFINAGMIYLFEILVENLELPIQVNTGSLIQVLILSIIVSVFGFICNKI